MPDNAAGQRMCFEKSIRRGHSGGAKAQIGAVEAVARSGRVLYDIGGREARVRTAVRQRNRTIAAAFEGA